MYKLRGPFGPRSYRSFHVAVKLVESSGAPVEQEVPFAFVAFYLCSDERAGHYPTALVSG